MDIRHRSITRTQSKYQTKGKSSRVTIKKTITAKQCQIKKIN